MRKETVKENGIPIWAKKTKEILNSENKFNISLIWLANQVEIHPVHLSRNFHKYFGTNLREYICNIKIEKAIYLMHNSALKKVQIAYECGFSDESHFIRIFKKHYKITPANYRKLNIYHKS